MTRLLAISHALWYGGAQTATLEFLEALRTKMNIRVLVCRNAMNQFVSGVRALGLQVREVDCTIRAGYPVMAIEEALEWVEWADVAWITDVEFSAAPRIKRIRKSLPVVAHLHSYALICPWWGALYGFREVCMEHCSAWRIVRCKQGINAEMAGVGLLGQGRARVYQALDFVKGPVDYVKWRSSIGGVVDSIDGFIAVSNKLWEIHISHMPVLRDKPHVVVYNLITTPLKYIPPRLDEPYGGYVLYASGANFVKGPHVLLEAWRQVEREFPDVRLLMTGTRGTWVEKIARNLGVKGVEFLGRVPEPQYYELMYKSRAVVLPSLWPEPFSLTPLEANRLGVPSVISDRSGVTEVTKEGVTGEVWRCCDDQELASVLLRVLTKKYKRLSITKYIDNVLDIGRTIEILVKFFETISR